jgi:hypothetical protein
MPDSRTRRSFFSAAFLTLLLFPGGVFQSTQGGVAALPAAQFIPPMSRTLLHFIENRGQVEHAIEYYLRLSSGFVCYYPDAVVYQSILSSDGNDPRADMLGEDAGKPDRPVRVRNIRARFVGASPQVTIKGGDKAEWI